MKKKKFIALILSALIAASALSGCSGNNGAQNSGTQQATETTTQQETESTSEVTDTSNTQTASDESAEPQRPALSFTKYDPPITLTTDRWIESEDGIDEWNEKPYIKWALETYGINWQPKFVAANHDDHLAQVQLLAASDDLPDVLADCGNMLPALYKSGHLRVLQDDIEQWGSDLTKYIWLEEYPARLGESAWVNKSNEDGKFYSIPIVSDPLESIDYNKLFIRGDIVEELGFDLPKNITELEEVMAAYKAKYPTQYPYRTAGWIYAYLNQIFAVNGSNPLQFYPGADGAYVYGSVQPETKQTLTKLRDWYSKGWIDPDYRNMPDYNTPFFNGEGLIIAGQVWFPGWGQPQLEANISSARIVPLDFLETEDGSSYESIAVVPTGWPAAITTNCKYPEAVIYEMNELFESQMRNEADLRAMFDFKYPVTEIQDPVNPNEVAEGKPAKFNYPLDAEGPGFLNDGDGSTPSICYGDRRSITTINNAKACFEALLANNNDMDATLNSLTGSVKVWFNSNFYSHGEVKGNPNGTWSKLQNFMYVDNAMSNGTITFRLNPWNYKDAGLQDFIDFWDPAFELEQTYFHGIIMGELPIDDFDKFVSEWKANGGEQMLDAVNKYHGN